MFRKPAGMSRNVDNMFRNVVGMSRQVDSTSRKILPTMVDSIILLFH